MFSEIKKIEIFIRKNGIQLHEKLEGMANIRYLILTKLHLVKIKKIN